MQNFLSRYHDRITSVLSGFDRVVFRGTLRELAHVNGLMAFLAYKRVLLTGFGQYAESMTKDIKTSVEQWAESLGRPVHYVQSSRVAKEDIARMYLESDGIREGLVCVLNCVEPCQTFEIHRSREKKLLELRSRERKCLHHYAYFLDPDFGFMHVRLQTWLPFTARVCINGREWLACQMDKRGMRYRRADNCFLWIEEPEKAQALVQELLKTDWSKQLDSFLFRVHHAHAELFRDDRMDYYWSTHQAEWATDVLFQTPAFLAKIYPQLTRHAMLHFQSPDVLRFLGKRLTSNFTGEVTSDYKRRPEGVRVKHRVKTNSVKMYDKQESVLRIETTINDPRDFRVFRAPEGQPEAEKSWRPMRKGVADLHRLTEISQRANETYLEALSTVEVDDTLIDLIEPLTKPTTIDGRRFRALQPFGIDADAFRAINRGEFLLNGFRNRDLVNILYPRCAGPEERRRAQGRVTRLLRLLRAHHVIKKVPRTHRYQLTEGGQQVIAAVLAANETSVKQLLAAA